MIDLGKITGFDWDKGNARKNQKHGVSTSEAEQVLFNIPVLFLDDLRRSQLETRYHALGVTDGGRGLYITFTWRLSETLIRVISARGMNRKERAIYEQST